MGEINARVEEDRRHHHDDRRDRVPDEPPGAERGGRGGARRASRAAASRWSPREVRNLAQRSATAAKEIKGLIQDSVQKVEAGSELVNQSGETLQEIVGVGEAGDRHHRRDRRGVAGAVDRHRAGEQGGRADGPGDAVERRADRGAVLHGAVARRPGGGAAGAGRAVQACRRPGPRSGHEARRAGGARRCESGASAAGRARPAGERGEAGAGADGGTRCCGKVRARSDR